MEAPVTNHQAIEPGLAAVVERHGATLEASYPDKECGCPVEEWVVNGVSLSIHFEPDGKMEAFADTGDWETDVPLNSTTMDAAREEAFAWAMALPNEDA